MADLLDGQIAGPALAALSAACFVFAIFRPRMNGIPTSARRSVLYRKLVSAGDPAKRMAESRSLKRAQEAALKSVAKQEKKRRQSRLQDSLSAAGFSWPPRHFIAVCTLSGVGMCLLILSTSKSVFLAIIFGSLAGGFIPLRYLSWRAERRKQAFLKAFSPAIEMIIRGTKSGLSLMDCLAMVASDAASPVREEFQNITSQLAAGVTLTAAMERLARTTPTAEIRFFTMVMSAQSQTGGNLTDALSNLANVLHQRQRLATKIRIASAEGKISALIIGILPFFVIGGTYAFSPDYISFLWTDETGHKAGLFSLVWLVIGFFVLIRMSKFEV
ncbi:MAG TPA: type II secretion system F family protein [Hyphomicrobiales bacterium]|nr:type II secretion system F family protein [Hyphomicrobiales bacterium]